MTYDEIQVMLRYIKGLHVVNRSRIDFAINDKKHAIYILQGGIITACCRAMDFNEKGYHMSTGLHKRIIDEAINLIMYFDQDIGDTSRHLRAWFKGEVVERKLGRDAELSVEERAKLSNSSPELIETIDDLSKKLNNATSKYMHPTISIMRSNLSKKTNLYDYDYKIINRPALSQKDFGNFYLIPTLNSMRTAALSLPLIEIDFIRIRNYIDVIKSST